MLLDRQNSRSFDFPGGLVVRLCTSSAGGKGLVPDWGAKTPRAT